MQENLRNSYFVSSAGGTLDFVADDGELLMSVAVPKGIVPAHPYLMLCPEGAEPQVSDGLVLSAGRCRSGIQMPHDMHESGANPDFQPTSASRNERMLQFRLASMQAEQRTLSAKLTALSAIERIPEAPPQAAPKPTEEPEAAVVE